MRARDWIGHTGSAILFITIGAGCTAAVQPHTTPASPPAAVAAAPAQAQTSAPQVKYVTGWVDGTYMVGTGANQIPPGTYETHGQVDHCYWARLRDTTGSFSAIIANDNVQGHGILTILPSDKAVEFSGGATWVAMQ